MSRDLVDTVLYIFLFIYNTSLSFHLFNYTYINYGCTLYYVLFQIFYMLELTRLFLRNLRKSTCIPATLLSSYLKFPISMDKPVSNQDSKKVMMEPYLGTHYNQNNATAMCNIPFNTAPGNMIYCHANALDTTQGVKTNSCGRSVKCLRGNQIFDKQRYKTMRKWKRFGKGIDNYFISRLSLV